MYCRYVTTNAPVNANLVADFTALATGATIASLSASCDKANSSLVSTVAPGWTLFDSAAANNGKVLSSVDGDSLTTKYVNLFSLNTTNMSMTCAEGWDATAHTGTNVSSSSVITTLANTVSVYHVFATPRFFAVITTIAGGTDGLLALETTREAPYLVGSTYPVVVTTKLSSFSTTAGNYMPRRKNLVTAGDLTTTSALVAGLQLGARVASVPTLSDNYIVDGTDNAFFEVRPIWCGVYGPDLSLAGTTAYLGKFYEIQETARNAGASFDTMFIGTDQFMMFSTALPNYILKMA